MQKMQLGLSEAAKRILMTVRDKKILRFEQMTPEKIFFQLLGEGWGTSGTEQRTKAQKRYLRNCNNPL